MIYFLSNIIQQGRQTEVGYCHLKYTNYCGYNCKECYVPDLYFCLFQICGMIACHNYWHYALYNIEKV